MADLFHYFVEGECEEKIIYAFSHKKNNELRLGKIEVFNVLMKKCTPLRAKGIKRGTYVVFVYDSDGNDTSILEHNIKMLKKYAQIDDDHIIHLISVKNFEDEIVRATNIKNINELFNTASKTEFKKKFIGHKNVIPILVKHEFDIKKMWSTKPNLLFEKYYNNKKQKVLI